MFIEDEELRTLYRDASADYLNKLEAGLLHLEKYPDDRDRLQGLLRATHSLKGDSKMLGVQDAETLVHQLEDLLSAVEQGNIAFTSNLCDRLYQGLDAVRKVVHAAVTGESAGISVFHVLAELMGADESIDESAASDLEFDFESESAEFNFDSPDDTVDRLTTASNLINLSDQIADPFFSELSPSHPHVNTNSHTDQLSSPLTAVPPESATPSVSTSTSDSSQTYQIDTVRVESSKLDTLTTQVSELAVTKLRVSRRIDHIEQLLTLWQTWNRDTFVNRGVLNALEQQVDADTLAPLQKFYALNARRLEECGAGIEQLRTTVYEDTARLETVVNQLEAGIRTLRLLPLSGLFNLFPRMIRDLSKQQNKEINLVIEGSDTQADKRILEEMQAPLTHILRNAIDHGIETPEERIAAGKAAAATIRLKADQIGSSIRIQVIDDGRGLDLEAIKRTAIRRGLYSEADLARMTPTQIQALIFAPGFSTRTTVTEVSGRGVGLDVVRANVERLKGSIQVDSTPNQGCRFEITLSTSLATTNALIVEVNQTPYAMPIESVDRMFRVDRQEIYEIEGRPTITYQKQPLSVAWLADLLELPASPLRAAKGVDPTTMSIPCIVLTVGSERFGLLVDHLIEQQDIVLKPQSKLLRRIRNISGVTILSNGEICMVLNLQDLLISARGGTAVAASEQRLETLLVKPKVLLVEDSIPIRTQLKRILEGAGYEVTAAVDGLDGFNKLQTDLFNAVISDIEMPNLNGLELTTQIRQQPEYEKLPIILVTTLAKEEDKRRGVDAGADAYITKGDFDQTLLIDTLRRLT
jgi:two-component system, chemotaxis family, sensor kinase CheA